MKKTVCFLIVILVCSISLAQTQIQFTNRGWNLSTDIKAYENYHLTLALASGIPYVGITYKDHWEEFSGGFFKMKIRDGDFRGSILASHEGLYMAARYVSNTNQIPVFSHSLLELELSSLGDRRYLVRNWFRLPLGQINGGLSTFIYRVDDFAFNDIGLYLYAKEFERSFRLRNAETNVVVTVDLKTSDSLGEMGYGFGVGMNYMSFDLGAAFSGNFIVPAGDLKLVLSPMIMVSLRGIDAQLLISKLGSDDSVYAGISITNFKLNGVFMRLIF